MAASENVSAIPRPLPTFVEIEAGTNLAPTADEMDRLSAAAELPLSVLLGDDDNIDQLPNRQRAIIWLALRRQGFDPSFAECGGIELRRVTATPDPTDGG